MDTANSEEFKIAKCIIKNAKRAIWIKGETYVVKKIAKKVLGTDSADNCEKVLRIIQKFIEKGWLCRDANYRYNDKIISLIYLGEKFKDLYNKMQLDEWDKPFLDKINDIMSKKDWI